MGLAPHHQTTFRCTLGVAFSSSLPTEDIIIFAVTDAVLEIKSGPRCNHGWNGRAGPMREDHCYMV
jgi:hypothetical protein